MTVLFNIELRKLDGNPKYLAVVKGVEAGLVGVFSADGKVWTPDREAIKEALPHYYRKAFARAGSFWFDTNDNAYCKLSDTRGNVLVTIWATPYVK